MKYIDADKLIAEIESLMNSETRCVALKSIAYKKVVSLITSLQQEQPEVFDTVAFQKGVQEGRRLEKEDAK